MCLVFFHSWKLLLSSSTRKIWTSFVKNNNLSLPAVSKGFLKTVEACSNKVGRTFSRTNSTNFRAPHWVYTFHIHSCQWNIKTNTIALVLFSLKGSCAHASAFTLMQPGRIIIQNNDRECGFVLALRFVKQRKADWHYSCGKTYLDPASYFSLLLGLYAILFDAYFL